MVAFENMTQWKCFLSHWLTNRITALPLSTLGDSTGSLILPNRVLIKASHLLAPCCVPATLQYPPATSLINNMCWMSTFRDTAATTLISKAVIRRGVLLHCFKVRTLKPAFETIHICHWLEIIETSHVRCGFHRKRRSGLFVFVPKHLVHRCHCVYPINPLFLLGSMKLPCYVAASLNIVKTMHYFECRGWLSVMNLLLIKCNTF